MNDLQCILKMSSLTNKTFEFFSIMSFLTIFLKLNIMTKRNLKT